MFFISIRFLYCVTQKAYTWALSKHWKDFKHLFEIFRTSDLIILWSFNTGLNYMRDWCCVVSSSWPWLTHTLNNDRSSYLTSRSSVEYVVLSWRDFTVEAASFHAAGMTTFSSNLATKSSFLVKMLPSLSHVSIATANDPCNEIKYHKCMIEPQDWLISWNPRWVS